MEERLAYKVSEIGELLGISRSLAYQLVGDGTIPSFRLGRAVRVPATALHELIARLQDGNTPQEGSEQ
jgi:excisionase family DNA binding protein